MFVLIECVLMKYRNHDVHLFVTIEQLICKNLVELNSWSDDATRTKTFSTGSFAGEENYSRNESRDSTIDSRSNCFDRSSNRNLREKHCFVELPIVLVSFSSISVTCLRRLVRNVMPVPWQTRVHSMSSNGSIRFRTFSSPNNFWLSKLDKSLGKCSPRDHFRIVSFGNEPTPTWRRARRSTIASSCAREFSSTSSSSSSSLNRFRQIDRTSRKSSISNRLCRRKLIESDRGNDDSSLIDWSLNWNVSFRW